MTSESDERCRQCGATGLTAERLRWATPVCFRCVRKTASEFADEVSTLRAKLAEAERAWEQHESGDVSCSWHELATGQTIEAERAKAERDAANARAAEAERELEAKAHAYDIAAEAALVWMRKARLLAERVSLAETGSSLRRNGPTIRLLAARDEVDALTSPLAALAGAEPPSAEDAARFHREALIETAERRKAYGGVDAARSHLQSLKAKEPTP